MSEHLSFFECRRNVKVYSSEFIFLRIFFIIYADVSSLRSIMRHREIARLEVARFLDNTRPVWRLAILHSLSKILRAI